MIDEKVHDIFKDWMYDEYIFDTIYYFVNWVSWNKASIIPFLELRQDKIPKKVHVHVCVTWLLNYTIHSNGYIIL